MISLASILFIVGGLAACLGEPSPAAFHMTLGGVGGAAAAFPLLAQAATADWPLFGKIVAIVISIGALLAAWPKLLGKPRETQTVRLDPPTVTTRREETYVTHDELQCAVGGLATKLQLAQMEQGIESKMHTQFRALDEKRSKSIGELHQHIASTAREQAVREEKHVEALHDKINAIAIGVAELRGGTKGKRA